MLKSIWWCFVGPVIGMALPVATAYYLGGWEHAKTTALIMLVVGYVTEHITSLLSSRLGN